MSQGAEKGEALSRAGGWQRKVFDVTKERDQEGREKMHERPWKDTKRMRWNDDSNHFFSLSDQCVCVCAYIQKGLGVWKGWVCVCVRGGVNGFPGQPLTCHWLISWNSEQNEGCDLTAAWALSLAFTFYNAALFCCRCLFLCFSLFLLLMINLIYSINVVF